jgi:hypothetical protein
VRPTVTPGDGSPGPRVRLGTGPSPAPAASGRIGPVGCGTGPCPAALEIRQPVADLGDRPGHHPVGCAGPTQHRRTVADGRSRPAAEVDAHRPIEGAQRAGLLPQLNPLTDKTGHRLQVVSRNFGNL